jgi:hypothetical protein
MMPWNYSERVFYIQISGIAIEQGSRLFENREVSWQHNKIILQVIP